MRWVSAIATAFAAVSALISPAAHAGDLLAQMTGNALTGLTWLSPSPQVEIESRWNGTGALTVADLRGRFVRPGWILLSGSQKIRLSDKGAFRIVLPVVGPITSLSLTCIGPKGEVERAVIRVTFPTYGSYLKDLYARRFRRFHMGAGLNLSVIHYTDTNQTDFSEKAITAKLDLSYRFAPHWSIQVGGFYTLVPLTKTGDDSARYLGVNSCVGFQVPGITEPWTLSLRAGIYYVTMFVTNNDFGFINAAGPELFPVLRRTLPNGDAILAYFKFAPVTTAATGGFFASRELSGGAAYAFHLRNDHDFSITFDASSFQLLAPGVTVNTSSYSLGLAYSLF